MEVLKTTSPSARRRAPSACPGKIVPSARTSSASRVASDMSGLLFEGEDASPTHGADLARELQAGEWRVLAPGGEARRIDRPFRQRVEDDDVSRCAGGKRPNEGHAGGEVERDCRPGGERTEGWHQFELSALDERQHGRKCCFDAANSGRGVVEFAELIFAGVGGTDNRIFREEEMARGHLAGHGNAAGLRFGDEFEPPRGAHMGNVEPGTGGLAEGDVSGDGDDFRGSRLTGQAEAFADTALVHAAASVEHWVI